MLLAQHVVYFGEHSVCTSEECVFSCCSIFKKYKNTFNKLSSKDIMRYIRHLCSEKLRVIFFLFSFFLLNFRKLDIYIICEVTPLSYSSTHLGLHTTITKILTLYPMLYSKPHDCFVTANMCFFIPSSFSSSLTNPSALATPLAVASLFSYCFHFVCSLLLFVRVRI